MHRRSGEQALDGVALPLGEGSMELGNVAEQRRFGQELADEGAHRVGDAFEREHLGDWSCTIETPRYGANDAATMPFDLFWLN